MRQPLLFAIPFLLLSCSSSQNTSPEETPSAVVKPEQAREDNPQAQETSYDLQFPKIEDKRWQLREYEYESKTYRPEREFTLRILSGQLSGKSGCNNYQSAIRLRKDGTMSVGDISSTKKLCQGAMVQERRFLQILQNARSYSVNKLFLEIYSELGKLSFNLPQEEEKK